MERDNVDTTETITHVGLCAGYGGIELGLKRVLPALRSVALCEIEAFAIANLVAKMEAGLMDPAPVWTDLKTFPWESFRDRVDVLTGGYPCQPFSTAGKRAGKDDPRHLWPWIADGIAAMRPKLCFFENVEGHISLGLSDVVEDLAGMGYRTTWGIFSASECGAPHQRKRVFIMAYNKDEHRWGAKRWSKSDKSDRTEIWDQSGEQGRISRKELAHRNGKGLERYSRLLTGCSKSRWQSQESEGQVGGRDSSRDVWPSRPGQPQHAWEPPRVVGNAAEQGCKGSRGANDSGWQVKRSAEPDRSRADRGMESEQRQTQPPLGGGVDGITDRLDFAELYVTCDNRTDELRLLGNGVVPACAALAFTTLLNEQRNPRHLT